MKAKLLIAALSFILLAGLAAAQSESELKRIDIAIFPDSVVAGDQFTVGEIASINGYNVELTKEISDIVVGPSPQPGQSILVNHGLINARLRKFSYYDININIPPGSMVSRSSLRVEGSEIATLAKQKLMASPGLQSEEYHLVGSVRDVLLPSGKLDYKISTRQPTSPAPKVISYQVEFFINGARKRMLSLLFRQGPADAGNTTSTSQPQEFAAAPTDNSTRQLTPSQQKAQKSILLAPLATGDVESPSASLVKSGALMKLVYRSGPLNLETEGLATKSGQVGDVIEFISTATKKKITARIVSLGEAEII